METVKYSEIEKTSQETKIGTAKNQKCYVQYVTLLETNFGEIAIGAKNKKIVSEFITALWNKRPCQKAIQKIVLFDAKKVEIKQ